MDRTPRPDPTPKEPPCVSPSSVPAHLASPTRRRDQRGITTAEYAVGTAAGAGLAGLLFKLLTGGFGEQSCAPCSTTSCPCWASGEA